WQTPSRPATPLPWPSPPPSSLPPSGLPPSGLPGGPSRSRGIRAMPDIDSTEEYAREAREPQGYRRSDEEMALEIFERLADDVGLDARGVYVEVRRGEATLHGVVRRCADIPRAEGHACAVAGVTSVRNDLAAKESSEEVRRPAVVGAASKMGKPTYE